MASPGNYQETTFRDRPTTFGKDGKRVWLYPKMPKGKLFNIRRILAWALLAFFFIAPYIKLNGEPLIFLNFADRKFVLFGGTFYPQDFHLLVLSIIALVVFIVLFTVIYGRVFCGWICPQTVFMEFLYRPIEYLIDGNPEQQRKLKEMKMNAVKFGKRTLKHGIFLIISLATILTFVIYIVGAQNIGKLITGWPTQNFGILLTVLAFTGAHYFVFAWFREQVCTVVCPYGRLQGVMLDVNTIQVAYDYKRGEPRGRGTGGKNGDCSNCRKCVTVCPTGIDIRNGTQLECINCTACIDACNEVMMIMNRPKGLIRFASEKSISEGNQIRFNARVIAYSSVLFVLLAVIGYLVTVRGSVETTIIRAQGTLFQEYGPDHYSNLYNLEMVNKTSSPIKLTVKLLSPEGEIMIMGDSLKAEKGEVIQRNMLIVLRKETVKPSNHLEIGIFDGNKLIDKISSTFVGPN